MRVMKGVLEFWAETGTEGAVWILYEDGMTGYEGMVELEAGDRLRVFDESGACIHDVVIDPDHEVGKVPHPLNPEVSQQLALGLWVHWIQRGWEPNAWGALFIRYRGQKPFRAEIHRRKSTICLKCGEEGFDGWAEKEFCDCGKKLQSDRLDGPELHCCEDCARKLQICKFCGGSPVTTD